MCGICGIINFDGAHIDPSKLVKMRDLMRQRGPDDKGAVLIDGKRYAEEAGYFCFKDVDELNQGFDRQRYSIGLAHRRLSIIDLSADGCQPMSNAVGSIWIIFNGEIYNFLELKSILKDKGYEFRTRTDTEVIIYAYEEWGKDFVSHLRGMFAIALWDSNKSTCILARDRFGIKPLFYFWDEKHLIFSSDITSLLASGLIQPEINPEAVLQYFKYHYIPAPNTIFKGIFSLLPAQELVCAGGQPGAYKYWQIHIDESVTDEQKAIYLVESELSEAITQHLIADVPVGCFLSGGVDSSLVTYFAREVLGSSLKAYCIGFKEAEYDESGYAQMVADYLGIDINIDVLQETPNFSEISNIVGCLDQPFADSSLIPTFQVCRNARRYFPVALSGDGGDEIFAGYSFRLQKAADFLSQHWLLSLLTDTFFSLISVLGLSKCFGGAVSKFYRFKHESLSERYISYHLKSDKYLELVSHDIANQHDSHPDFIWSQVEDQRLPNSLNGMLSLCVQNNLSNDMLFKVDRASMAHALEVRVPFLDHKLVETAFRLSCSLKQPGILKNKPKYILKKISSRKLPQEAVFRSKMGFSVPIGQWQSRLHSYIRDILSKTDQSVVDYLNRDLLTELYEGNANLYNDADNWAVLCFLIWYDNYRKNSREFKIIEK